MLLGSVDGNSIKRLVNIHSIYQNGEFFEYKITLDGFPRGNWVFVKKAQLHSVDGFIRSGGKRKLQGTHIEISYHRDGKTAYKDVGGEWNIKPMIPNIPIRKISKPRIFFRIAGFRIMDLVDFNATPTGENDLLNILPYSPSTRLTCDFHMSGRPDSGEYRYGVTLEEKNPFKNSHFVDFEDSDEHIDLHLHFYETEVDDGPYFTIMRNDWWGKAKQKFHYFIYSLKKSLRSHAKA